LGYGSVDNVGDNEYPSAAGFVNAGGVIRSISVDNGQTCAVMALGGDGASVTNVK
jgi:hypothetical protein